MQLSMVSIENFRAHTSTAIPLTQLGSLIGENNAGKSSVLHAIQYALEERRLDDADFRDATKPIAVTLHLTGIGEQDLERVGDSHREKVAGMIRDGNLTIVRSQTHGGKAEPKYLKLVPSDPRWSVDNLNDCTKGKSGTALRTAAVELRPELEDLLGQKVTKGDVVAAWNELNQQLPKEDLQQQFDPYPTGISTAIKPLFPSVIYIESVKDASLEARASGTSAFAKLLGLLFEEVQEQFDDIEEKFNAVHQKLNRHLSSDGEPKDTRLPAVKRIETVIEQYVTASFPGVKVQMDIPAPTLSVLLSSADLLIDDGHVSKVSSKGDGLKRNVLFALLRAYADIRDNGLGGTESDEVADSIEAARNDESPETCLRPRGSYLLLFEEPELYLHPRAQRQLMAALTQFAKDHQVLVTTHSPGFFQPGTKGFTRMYKTDAGVVARPVDLTLKLKDEYQIVRHENNEAAFFAQKVVLVEGDSDTFVFPHLAKLFSKGWDDVERNVMFVKIGGKGNISRYRTFFEQFEVPIHVIADLDALSNGFEHLTSTSRVRESHGKLIQSVKEQISGPSTPDRDKVKEIVRSRSHRELWGSAQENFGAWRDIQTKETAQAVVDDLTELFDAGNGDAILAQLQNPPTEQIADLIEEVISSLALEDTYVLRRGDLETYCGTHAKGEKVATAMKFCAETLTLDALKKVHGTEGPAIAAELEDVFSGIFDSSAHEPETNV
ncbi:AAA domain-containing protein, putative AbiEii toxin, Type IV TA system [Brevibacterium sandarakinum]|uniref:AAA domain-containing protein, putative AbiEii toxin, Type IV TA system n=1 Tax=Brevibacterium sandarakinum TaxID=629680 RepID=A0A1H1X2N4_BRESA|nr:AAA family ATPase [Brevibacterium sandarakinum]SDT03607.1 AAA domain-containing protein, putative AbiEii toxin, Type IV TA system [Brevibacterium sandarakinum]